MYINFTSFLSNHNFMLEKYSSNKHENNTNNYNKLSFLGKKDYTENEKEYFEFKKQLSAKFHKIKKVYNDALWNFYVNSTKENADKNALAYENFSKLIANPKILKKLNVFKKNGISDENLTKSLNELIKDYTKDVTHVELRKKIENKEYEIAFKFNNCRGEIDGKKYSNTDLINMLENEKNIEMRKKLYYEFEVKGPDLIADDLIDLVKIRNEYAHKLGYNDFFSYEVKEHYKIDEKKLFELLDTLNIKTQKPYSKISYKDDAEIAEFFKIKTHELRPYHYGIQIPGGMPNNINSYIKNNNQMKQSVLLMYKRMGWDIPKLPILLDIFPKANKHQHGICINVNINKDIRVLLNLRNDFSSIKTLAHDLGHAVYDAGISEHIQYFKRKEATLALTEAVAMLMESLPLKEDSLINDLTIPKKLFNELNKSRQNELISFVRRYLLYINFEKELYANPNQNIPKLWYNLEKKYLFRNIPEVLDNKWASIPHFLSHPAYLQNYLRAEIMAAQIYDAAIEKLGPLTKNKNTAEFFRKKLFRFGATLKEEEIIKKLTGKKLSTEAFLKQLKHIK